MTPFLLAFAVHAKAPDPAQTAATLTEAALASDRAWERLVELSDDIGPRLSGTPAHDRAVAWAQEAMREDGLVRVRAEAVTVQGWERGAERAALVAPVAEPLAILGLGNTIGTPEGGIEADVVIVSDWEGLDALGEQVRGKIVLYDVPFTTYDQTVAYRWAGPSRASALGAVAMLIRSVGPVGSATLHTGSLGYDDAAPAIPAAAISAEDAMRLHRYADRGLPVRVRLEMGARHLGDRPSANVIGEVQGKKKGEYVVLGCHLDSWDVGRGAQDDGAGCVEVMEAARLIAALPTPPARSLRVVLYTNEENGGAGSRAYAEAHAAETHVAALESDVGGGPMSGFGIDLGGDEPVPGAADPLIASLAPVVPLLEPLGAGTFEAGFSGSDVRALVESGVIGFGAQHDTAGYWPVHHTAADTADKVDPAALQRNAAAIAVLAWWLAEHPPVIDSSSAVLPRGGR